MATRRSLRSIAAQDQGTSGPTAAVTKPAVQEAHTKATKANLEKAVPITRKRKPLGTVQRTGTPKKARFATPDPPPDHEANSNATKQAIETRNVLQHPLDMNDRPAEPHATNAPLVTPRGSRLVTYKSVPTTSPLKAGVPAPTTSTTQILEDACSHLVKVEPRMKPLIDQYHCRMFSSDGLAEECDPFKSLCSGIMAQQVSGAAASSIKRKFVGLFHSNVPGSKAVDELSFPTPQQVAVCSVPFLRQAGLSERKAEYIQGLAEKFADGELSPAMLMSASDEEIMERLTAVRGLGRWSVEMFACFGLKRLDIFSTGDLGVQRGMAAFMGKDVSKLKAKGGGKWKYMSEKDMIEHAEKFSPYRSVFMWYMWRVEGVDVNVVEQA